MTKKINLAAIFFFLVVFCMALGKPVYASISDDVKLVINQEQVAADVMPFIKDGRTLVPARAVFEALGGTVEWDEKNYIVTVKYDKTTVILKINNTVAIVDGKNKILDVPATIKDDRTVIPVRFVAEELGFPVEWVESTRTVIISSPEKIEEVPVVIGSVMSVSVEEGSSKSENTIVTVQLSEPVNGSEGYSSMTLTSPNRFVLDLKNFKVGKKVSDVTHDKKDSPLDGVRIADYDENTVRIVCDLKELTTPSVTISDDGKILTISFKILSTYFEPMEDGKLVVVLDPGHGEATAGKRSPDGSLREYEFKASSCAAASILSRISFSSSKSSSFASSTALCIPSTSRYIRTR